MAVRHAQSIEEIFPLIDYCRQGMLEEARAWAESGRPLDPPLKMRRNTRRVPLLIAIDKGFFSMASLLIQNGADPMHPVNALQYAIYQDRPEIVKLLLDLKAVPRDAVEFSTVCDHGNPEIIKIFIDHGADIHDGLPLYHALLSNPLAMARSARDLKASHPEIQAQLDMALRHHVEDASGKVIGLLLWAGAQPHVETKDPGHPDEEPADSAIEAAARRGDLAILKQMHPERHPELVPKLTGRIYNCDEKMLEYLIGLGAPINDKPNGGSSLLDSALWSLYFPGDARTQQLPAWISFLAANGARWIPDGERGLADVRRTFHKASGDVVFGVIKALFTSGLATAGQIKELIRTPKMHVVLGDGRLRGVEHLLDPPKPKAPELPPPDERVSRRRRITEFSPDEGERKAQAWVLDQICENPEIRFWMPFIESQITPDEMRRLLGMDEDCKREPAPFLERATRWAQKHLKRVTLQGRIEERMFRLEIQLAKEAEWKDALAEAWKMKGSETPHHLSSAGAKLLEWASNPATARTPTKEVSLSHKLGMNGRIGHVEALIHEIKAKAGGEVKSFKDGDRWQRGGAVYHFSVSETEPLPDGACLDLAFDEACLSEHTKNLRPYRRQVEDALLAAKLKGDSLVYLFRVSSRASLMRSFPGFNTKRSRYDDNVAKFVSKLKLHHALRVFYGFRSEAPCWYAAVRPTSTWKAALHEIRETLNRPPPSKLWGISEPASVLLQGLLELRTAERPNRWMVPLSGDMCEEMGLDHEWLDSNRRTWITIFTEEINEMTPYLITVHPWKSWRDEDVCLHCRTKEASAVQT